MFMANPTLSFQTDSLTKAFNQGKEEKVAQGSSPDKTTCLSVRKIYSSGYANFALYYEYKHVLFTKLNVNVLHLSRKRLDFHFYMQGGIFNGPLCIHVYAHTDTNAKAQPYFSSDCQRPSLNHVSCFVKAFSRLLPSRRVKLT